MYIFSRVADKHTWSLQYLTGAGLVTQLILVRSSKLTQSWSWMTKHAAWCKQTVCSDRCIKPAVSTTICVIWNSCRKTCKANHQVDLFCSCTIFYFYLNHDMIYLMNLYIYAYFGPRWYCLDIWKSLRNLYFFVFQTSQYAVHRSS